MILVINYRYKVLVDGTVQKVFHVTVNMNRFVGGSSLDCHDRNLFGTFQVCKKICKKVYANVCILVKNMLI